MENEGLYELNSGQYCNLVPQACDPREGTWGSGIIRFREESDWPLIWNEQFNLIQDSWLPATDYPRASRSFPRIAGSGNEIGQYCRLGLILYHTSEHFKTLYKVSKLKFALNEKNRMFVLPSLQFGAILHSVSG
jgi:hypothetical protein